MWACLVIKTESHAIPSTEENKFADRIQVRMSIERSTVPTQSAIHKSTQNTSIG